MSKNYGQDEPVAKALDVLGDRWTLLIIRDLLAGKSKFAELSASLTGIPSNLLSERLKLLVSHGLVERRLYSEYPPRAEYCLTKRGEDLRPIVVALARWGTKHISPEPARKARRNKSR